MQDLRPIKTALLSVTDKAGLEPLARALTDKGVHLISTGGTGKFLRSVGISYQEISEFTGHPEAFQGRMKTISFAAASALLFRRGDASDELEAAQLGIKPIDLVVCNLYPFEEVQARGESEEVLIENIDIGGPLMIRAAAKNFAAVTVLSSPAQYERFLDRFNTERATRLVDRRQWAKEAFTRIAAYDVAITQSFGDDTQANFLTLRPHKELRYGENPHQSAKVYRWNNVKGEGLLAGEILQGKELSYNNMLDADAAWKAASELQHLMGEGTAAVVIKHGNPCGFVHAGDPLTALKQAWVGDATSSFGGIIAISTTFDETMARFFDDKFIEVLLAPCFTVEARQILATKKNLRVMELPLLPEKRQEHVLRSFAGGLLFQSEDESLSEELKPVTKTVFTEENKPLARFGVLAAKHLKSNAIALVRKFEGGVELAGAGMGQPNRLDSLLKLALPRLAEKGITPQEVVLVSDAFFPFADSIEVAAAAGIRQIVQPGGSIKDQEVIAKANELGVAMVMTGERHFRH